MKIIDYEMIYADELPLFNLRMSSAISHDWQPYGEPFMKGVRYCQAVVKYEKDK